MLSLNCSLSGIMGVWNQKGLDSNTETGVPSRQSCFLRVTCRWWGLGAGEETGTTLECYGSSQRKLGKMWGIFSKEQAERTAGAMRTGRWDDHTKQRKATLQDKEHEQQCWNRAATQGFLMRQHTDLKAWLRRNWWLAIIHLPPTSLFYQHVCPA